MGYRPFPSIDDFAYAVWLLKSIDPGLYPNDLAIEGWTDPHAHLHWLGRLLVRVIPLPLVLFIAVLCLAGLTAYLAWLFIRRLGGRGNLLLLFLYGLGGTVLVGVGRGTYDGLFGRAFHLHWVGLCLVLAAYLSRLDDKDWRCGLFLGLAVYGHVLNAAHGFFVIGCALTADALINGWRPAKWLKSWGLGLAIGLPRLVSVAQMALGGGTAEGRIPTGGDVYHDLLAWRFPHEQVDFIPWNGQLAGLWLIMLGAAALFLLRPVVRKKFPSLAGLILGQGLLLGLFVLVSQWWTSAPLLLHRIHLSRTSPLLIFLLLAAVVAAVESGLLGQKDNKPGTETGRTGSAPELAAGLILVSLIMWEFILGSAPKWLLIPALAFLFIGPTTKLPRLKPISRAVGPTMVVVGLIWLALQPIEQPLDRSEKDLFTWIESNTTRSDLFITPPAFSIFRLYAKRPIYCSFRPFLVIDKPMAYEMKNRLILTCRPDAETREQGFRAVDQWNRCYLRRNPPARIKQLLDRTKAAYWLQDRAALETPAYYPPLIRENVPGLDAVYRNDRFTVYRLARGDKP